MNLTIVLMNPLSQAISDNLYGHCERNTYTVAALPLGCQEQKQSPGRKDTAGWQPAMVAARSSCISHVSPPSVLKLHCPLPLPCSPSRTPRTPVPQLTPAGLRQGWSWMHPEMGPCRGNGERDHIPSTGASGRTEIWDVGRSLGSQKQRKTGAPASTGQQWLHTWQEWPQLFKKLIFSWPPVMLNEPGQLWSKAHGLKQRL